MQNPLFKSTFVVTFFTGLLSCAQSVTGLWNTVDEESGIVKSQVEIYEKQGKIYGRVHKVLDPNAPDVPLCVACKGENKDKPIEGLDIIIALEKEGDYYKDGTILDPEKGKEYDCKLWLDKNDSNILNVRGYVLFLYRTQQWQRVER